MYLLPSVAFAPVNADITSNDNTKASINLFIFCVNEGRILQNYIVASGILSGCFSFVRVYLYPPVVVIKTSLHYRCDT